MKYRKLIISAAVLAATCGGVLAVQPRAAKQVPMTVMVDKVDNENSDEVTRVTCALLSTPHTSSRIDSIALVRPGGKRFMATDIDGVDFRRYFQWEDESYLMVEVDFPLQSKAFSKRDTLEFYTVHGVVKASGK